MSDWQASASKDMLLARARLLADIRQFFLQRDVLEVETPLLAQAAVTDPNLQLFKCEGRFLQTSPEYAMKRLLADGVGAIYQVAKAFRLEEMGSRHNPEFTLLEWYQPGYSARQLMAEVLELLQQVLGPLECQYFSYQQLFQKFVGLDALTASKEQLLECLHASLELDFEPEDRDTCLDLILTHLVEPQLQPLEIVCVYDYPASQAALARLRQEGDYLLAERFEFYVRGIELANGYAELTDGAEQAHRFEQDNQKALARGQGARVIDQRLLAALEYGLPECAGVALGLDRLLMLMTGSENIGQVLSFDWSRA